MSIFRQTNRTAALNNFRTLPEFDNHEMLIALSDEATGLKAYIGIHNTHRGPALGGTRLQAYQNESEAIKDVLNLSQAMSYKCALANLPYGGGKAVIIIDGKKTNDILVSYAKRVDALRGLFKTGTDVGISDDDVALMAKHTSHMLGMTKGDRTGMSTASSAALGVFYAMKATLIFLYKDDSFKGRRIAIKGVGKLGGELARLLHKAGAKLYISDINASQCRRTLKLAPGAEILDIRDIHKQEVDIYAPCALGNEFTDHVIKELRCRAIVGGANNQLPDAEAAEKLHQRNICYVPDYIANAGGLIYVADELEADGFQRNRVIERIEEIQATVENILVRAAELQMPTSQVADTIAQERIGIVD